MRRRTTGKTPGSKRRTAARLDQAFSTGQVARYCYVTADTIVNWINSGKLQAQRTAGGQFRVRLDDLREFMNASGMRTDLLDAEHGVRPYCWEFHCQGTLADECRDCVVYRSGAWNCFTLAELHPTARRRGGPCDECEYHARYADEKEDHRGDRSG